MFIEIIRDILDKSGPTGFSKTINTRGLSDKLKDETSHLDDEAGNPERVYNLLYPEKCPSRCANGKLPVFKNIKDGYRDFCASKNKCECSRISQSEKIKEVWTAEKKENMVRNYKKTILEKYGVENIMQSEEGLKKYQDSLEKKTGYRSTFDNPEVRKKSIETSNRKYGVDYSLQSKEIREKAWENNTDKDMSRARSLYTQQTGYNNPFQNPTIKDKIKETMNGKYGVEHPSKSYEIQNNKRKKEIEKYNRFHCSQRNIEDNVWEIFNDVDKVNELVNTKTVQEIAEIFGYKNIKSVYAKIKEMGIVLPRSSLERSVTDFLSNNDISFTNGDRSQIKPLELDFYIPEHNLAVEMNGLYWHSDIFKDKDYHLNKYNLCKQKGIRLISINEDEWNERSDIIKSKILSIIGKASKGLPARKLSVKEITSKEGNDFCEQYHIQGGTSAVIYSVGAFDNDDLVGVMLFSKQRTTGDIELIRFCHDGKTHAGLFSKMLKYSISNQKSWNKIISFADLRYSEGDLYEKTGFVLDKVIRPDYKYVRNNKTFHKSNFTKDRIMTKFNLTEEEIKNKTEGELMEDRGFCRIYDIGKMKYILYLND